MTVCPGVTRSLVECRSLFAGGISVSSPRPTPPSSDASERESSSSSCAAGGAGARMVMAIWRGLISSGVQDYLGSIVAYRCVPLRIVAYRAGFRSMSQ